MKIRDAKSGDLPEIDRIISEYWKLGVDHEGELQNPNSVFLVSEDGESAKICGVALMWISSWNRTGNLAELAVEKSTLRKGIGSQLVSALVQKALQKNLRAILVETQLGKKDPIDFYMSQGFRLCGYNDRYYTNSPKSSNDVAIFLSKEIAA